METTPPLTLESLSGIGPVNAEKLRNAGVESPAQLYQMGAEAAFLLIRQRSDPSACFHLLLALEASTQDIPKKQLPEPRRSELRQWYQSLE